MDKQFLNEQQYLMQQQHQFSQEHESQQRRAREEHQNNFNSNDTNILQRRLMDLQGELEALDNEYKSLVEEKDQMLVQNDRIKAQNKKIFEKITSHQEQLNMNANSIHSSGPENAQSSGMAIPQASLMESLGPSAAELTQNGVPGSESNIGEIHSLYQDLFLTDIKQEVEKAQSELKSCKQEQNNAQRNMLNLKKENSALTATLKRYRQMLQDLTNQKRGGLNQ